MSFSTADLAILKWSLGSLVVAAGLSSGMVTFSNHYLEQSLKEKQRAQQTLFDGKGQLLAVESDRDNMAAYALQYNNLLAQKIVGDELRLDWMEGLERLREQGTVIDLKYTISPQQSYSPSPALEVGNFQLSRSPMSLQLEVLHEEQLLRLFSVMHREIRGWYMLDGCTLTRSGSANELAPLKAECTGGWFTLKNRNAP